VQSSVEQNKDGDEAAADHHGRSNARRHGWSEAAAERGSGGSSDTKSGGLRKNGERGLVGKGSGCWGLLVICVGGFC
jgi:hypothetical protein